MPSGDVLIRTGNRGALGFQDASESMESKWSPTHMALIFSFFPRLMAQKALWGAASHGGPRLERRACGVARGTRGIRLAVQRHLLGGGDGHDHRLRGFRPPILLPAEESGSYSCSRVLPFSRSSPQSSPQF